MEENTTSTEEVVENDDSDSVSTDTEEVESSDSDEA